MSEDGSPVESHPSTPAPSPPRGSRRSRKVVFATLTVFAFLAVLEVIGRLLSPVGGNARWVHESSHVRLTGFPALNDILESDSQRFWRLKSNVPPRQIIGRVGADNLIFSFSTDGDGFRRMPVPASAQQTILFLGDSCTLGIGVDDDATIPATVQERLPGRRCINAGVPGYSAYQGREYLESIIEKLKPQFVVMCFGFNDDAAWDDRSDLEHAAQIAVPPHWASQFGVTRLIGRFASPSAARQSAGTRPRLTDAEFSAEIESMVDTCLTHKAQPILLIWPLREQLEKPGLTGKQFAIARVGQIKGAGIVDLVQAVRSRHEATGVGRGAAGQAPPVFADLLHFNKEGCAMAAARLINEINRATRVESSPEP